MIFNNKGQVAQILVQEHKCVPVECYVENSPSNFAYDHKNARQLTTISRRIKMLNENVSVHKVDAWSC